MATQVRSEDRTDAARHEQRGQQSQGSPQGPQDPAGRQRQPGPPGPLPQGIFAGYAQEHRPLWSYAALTGLFNAIFAGFLAVAKNADRPVPERIRVGDLVLLSIGTHKLSRLLTKDWVTSFLRAPFVEYKGEAGPGEVEEKARGTGLRLALGELLTCPYCLGQWVAAFFAYGLVLSPRHTRLVGTIFTMITLSDFLHKSHTIVTARAEQA